MMKYLLFIVMPLLSFFTPPLIATVDEPIHRVYLAVGLTCPFSSELQALLDTLPTSETEGLKSVDRQEWKAKFIEIIGRFVDLVESDNMYDAMLVANHDTVDEKTEQQQEPPFPKSKKKLPLPSFSYQLKHVHP